MSIKVQSERPNTNTQGAAYRCVAAHDRAVVVVVSGRRPLFHRATGLSHTPNVTAAVPRKN